MNWPQTGKFLAIFERSCEAAGGHYLVSVSVWLLIRWHAMRSAAMLADVFLQRTDGPFLRSHGEFELFVEPHVFRHIISQKCRLLGFND